MPKGRAVALLLVLALALRLWVNWWLTVPTPTLHADAFWYHMSAINLAEGRGYVHHFTGQPTAAWPPGYPFILSVLYRTFGVDPGWGFALNAVAGTITCWLAGLVAARAAGRRAQILATGLMAILPSHVLFSSLLLTETIFTTMLAALVLAGIVLVDSARERSALWWTVWGAFVGLAGLVRAEAVLLLAVPVLVPRAGAWRWRTALVAVAFAATGLVLAQKPWIVRNAELFGRFIPASTSFGRTFLIGHNPVADGGMNLWSPDPEADRRDLTIGGPERELAVDDRLRDAGLRYMLDNPAAEMRLVFQRLWRMYRADRVWNEWYLAPSTAPARVGTPGTMDPQVTEWIGRVSNAFYWGLMLLAVPALFRWKERSALRAVVTVILVWSAFYGVVLYGSERFHFPLMPLVCVLAAASIDHALARRGSTSPSAARA